MWDWFVWWVVRFKLILVVFEAGQAIWTIYVFEGSGYLGVRGWRWCLLGRCGIAVCIALYASSLSRLA